MHLITMLEVTITVSWVSYCMTVSIYEVELVSPKMLHA